jgi:hypothetical protein
MRASRAKLVREKQPEGQATDDTARERPHQDDERDDRIGGRGHHRERLQGFVTDLAAGRRNRGAAFSFGPGALAYDDAQTAATEEGLDVGLSRGCAAATPGEVCLDGRVLTPLLPTTLDRDGGRLVSSVIAPPVEHHGDVRIAGPVGAQRMIEADVLTADDDQLTSHPYGLLFAGARDTKSLSLKHLGCYRERAIIPNSSQRDSTDTFRRGVGDSYDIVALAPRPPISKRLHGTGALARRLLSEQNHRSNRKGR